ncbi:MAG: CPBP family intramembrane metalloprotease [Phycisphaeraceae bacterium]|nr:CPBP family intramembrane metalloprotease [Phycisphaeraceae bacterium]
MAATTREIAVQLAMLAPLCAAALAVLARTGVWRARTIQHFPPRDAGWGAVDLMVLPLGMLLGGTLLTMVVPWLHHVTSPPMRLALTTLAGQALLQGVVLAYVLIKLGRDRDRRRRFGFNFGKPFRHIAAGQLGLIVAMIFVMTLSHLLLLFASLLGWPLPEVGHDLLAVMRDCDNPAAMPLLLLSAIVVAPLLEEILFRGLVHQALAGILGMDRIRARIILAAGLFAFIHVGGVTWHVLPSLFALGLVLGYLYERTGSFVPSWTTHLMFNAFNVAVAMYAL